MPSSHAQRAYPPATDNGPPAELRIDGTELTSGRSFRAVIQAMFGLA